MNADAEARFGEVADIAEDGEFRRNAPLPTLRPRRWPTRIRPGHAHGTPPPGPPPRSRLDALAFLASFGARAAAVRRAAAAYVDADAQVRGGCPGGSTGGPRAKTGPVRRDAGVGTLSRRNLPLFRELEFPLKRV